MEDCLVPSLEDLEENPLIKDSFIGVTDPVKWPPGVEFVEADGSASIEASEFYYHPSQQQQQQQFSYVQSGSTLGGGRRRQESFNLGQLLIGPEAGQQPPLQPFLQQKQLSDNIDGNRYQQQSFVDSGSGGNDGSFESWMEDKTDLTLLSGWIGESATIDFQHEGGAQRVERPVAFPPTLVESDGVADKDQILQEIVRECEEIERRSSPTSGYSSSSSSSPVGSPSSSSISRPPSVAPSPRFTWTARPIATFALKRQQPTTITVQPASTTTTAPPKGLKARSKVVQKEKKKAQNREAATRYREKKRREREDTRSEMLTLEARNRELKTQVDDYQYEIDYLRNLMREIGLAK